MSDIKIDLTTLDLAPGNHTLKIKAAGHNYRDSDFSNTITWFNPAVLAKGDIISFDAFGDGTSKRFRIIKINNGITTLMSLDDDITSIYNGSIILTQFDNGSNYLKYADSPLDIAMNTSYYNSLSAEVRAALVTTNKVQSCYSVLTWSADNPDDSAIVNVHRTNNNKYEPLQRITQKTIGDRNCFVLDLDDIIEYFGVSVGGIIEGTDLIQLFKEDSSMFAWSSWLTSATANENMAAFIVYADYGSLNYRNYDEARVARPAFRIDLTNIQYTKE